MFVAWALLAACANALSSVLQRRAARDAPSEDALSVRLVVDLIRRPVWFAGMASLVAGFGLQALALHGGQLSSVEPILIVELPLTLLLGAAVFRSRVGSRDLIAALTMSAGLALLLLAGAPSGGDAGGVPDWGWLLTALVMCGLFAALTAAGWHSRQGDHRAALWAIAAGAGFGLAAALIKASTTLLHHGLGAVLGSWKPYAMVVAGVAGLYLFQNAVQAGRLVFAQPAVSLTDPLVSVLIGIVLFGEHIRGGWFILLELAGVGMMVLGTVGLAQSPLLATDAGAPAGSHAVGSNAADRCPV